MAPRGVGGWFMAFFFFNFLLFCVGFVWMAFAWERVRCVCRLY